MELSEIINVIRNAKLDEKDAIEIVEVLKNKNLIEITVIKKDNDSKIFTDFLEEFWNWHISPYVKEKLAHGKSIGKQHCYEMTSRVRSFYKNYFFSRTLDSITWKDIKAFSIFLSEKRTKPCNYKGNFAEKLSASYRNKILTAGKTALKWAFNEELIKTDPTARKISFTGTREKRRVLTPQEAEIIFDKINWTNKRSYIGNLLSITTGLRAGEVLAIRKSDIDPKKPILYCRHSFSLMDGLKSPKNGEARKVPLLPEVKNSLLELLETNPHNVDDPFIFYGLIKDKPMHQKNLINGLKAACKKTGIEPVVFHAHRHYYTARLADKMTADQIQRITGHKSRAIYDTYADHVIDKNIEDMAEATAQVFKNIIQIPQKKAI